MPGLLPPFLRDTGRNLWLYRWLARNVAGARSVNHLETNMGMLSVAVGLFTIVALLSSWSAGWETGFALVIGAAGLLFIIVDFASVFFGVAVARSQSAQLDLLRMTPLKPLFFVESLHQVAQVQTWRVFVIMQSIRLILVAAMFTVGIMATFVMIVFTFGAGLVWVVVLLALLLGEPIWRLQMMTAIGVMAGLRATSSGAAWGTGLGLMFAVWIGQGMLGTLPFIIMRASAMDTFWFIVPLTLVLVAMTWAIWWGQRQLRNFCLELAAETLN